MDWFEKQVKAFLSSDNERPISILFSGSTGHPLSPFFMQIWTEEEEEEDQ